MILIKRVYVNIAAEGSIRRYSWSIKVNVKKKTQPRKELSKKNMNEFRIIINVQFS